MLLIDRKMPESCIDCVCNNDDYRCNMTGDELDYDITWTGRMPNCPLKEEERKTGKWIDAKYPFSKCSICECYFDTANNIGNFCPNCGTDMREKP